MNRRFSNGAGRAGFTIVELLTSILVIGLLMGLLIAGIRYVGTSAQKTRLRAGATQLKQGVAEFKQKFGMLPPLVRDQHRFPSDKRLSVDLGTTPHRIAVFEEGQPSHQAFLKGVNFPVNPADPYSDPRFSVRALSYYLTGALDVPATTTNAGVSIDGVPGPGMLRPRADGSFEIPEETLYPRAGETPRSIQGDAHPSLLGAGAKDPWLYAPEPNASRDALYDPPQDTRPEWRLALRDSTSRKDANGVRGSPYRYYRWIMDTAPAAVNLGIPRMVLSGNNPPLKDAKDASAAAFRGASYAIVGAGPNGLFGDEPLGIILDRLGRDAAYPELAARDEAASDNIVEIGQ